MAHYAKIRGWVECNFTSVNRINEVIDQWRNNNADRVRESEGIHFPKQDRFWSYFFFVGVVVPETHLDAWVDLFKRIVSCDAEANGEIVVDTDHGETYRMKIEFGDMQFDEFY